MTCKFNALIVTFVIAAATLTGAASAHAEVPGAFGGGGKLDMKFDFDGLHLIAGIPSGVAATVATIGLTAHMAGDGESAPMAWEILGYSAGATTALVGLTGLGQDDEMLRSMSIAMVTVGLASCATATVSVLLPDSPTTRTGVSIDPLIVELAPGETAYGASVSVFGF